jgi:hypothetical protein
MKREIAIGLAGLALGAGTMGAVPKSLDSVIQDEQARVFAETGEYVQIMVNVYETPKGEWGYDIWKETKTDIISTGYGPEAESRTYMREKPQLTASTTP